MQLLQDTTNTDSQLSDNLSVHAFRALEVTHWKFMPHFLSGQLIKRTHSALINFSLQQASLAIVPFWYGGSRRGLGVFSRTQNSVLQMLPTQSVMPIQRAPIQCRHKCKQIESRYQKALSTCMWLEWIMWFERILILGELESFIDGSIMQALKYDTSIW